MHRKKNQKHKIKYIYMIDKRPVYMCLYIASIKSTIWNITRLFLSQFFISFSSLLILAKVFRYDYVAACSIALRRATKKNEMGGCVTVLSSCKMTQRTSTVDWIKF